MSQPEQNKKNDFLKTDGGKTKSNSIEVPSISLPKGGGALKGIDEKFTVNAVNGTASFSVPLPFSQARGASPSLSLSYNSGSGNGIFGLGWSLSLPSIKRKTDKALPQYIDENDTDTFLFSETEDLVPEFKKSDDGSFVVDTKGDYLVNEKDSTDGLWMIRYYRPRVEGLFARIERWTEKGSGRIKWRVTTKENLTTLFGWNYPAIIGDPAFIADPKGGAGTRIFQWLPEFVFDDKGNAAHYIYKNENGDGINESLLHNRNRINGDDITYTNTYLQKVLYGNKTPYKNFDDPFPADMDYLFQSVFDYGVYDPESPFMFAPEWDFRTDAFSDYKAGFEIRATRLCKRVLLFHNFLETEYNGLVRSLNFDYNTTSEKDFTFLTGITSYGFIKKPDGSYTHKKLPTLEFTYQQHEWNKDVKTIAIEDLVHAPAGLDESPYQFTDLFNEGLSGILSEQGNGWYYKHNLGGGKFEQAKLITPKPSFSGLGGQLQLADLDADGGKQLVSYGTEPKGYFELDDDHQWQPFKNFQNLPNINFGDANTRMLDLNGDGMAEVLITEENVFAWYPSEGRKGYSEPIKTLKSYDEEAGPYLVFADSQQTIFLADMSGDGLTDIVRIRNGEVCYWPNLGYGKFGAKVAMDNSPWFDHPDIFNPSFLRLSDIDGSGTTDIIYLGKNTFSCWLNLSGNAFSTSVVQIDAFPQIDSHSRISVMDLLGNGVACIVWSSGLSKDTGMQIRYIDLMNSKKPHILVKYINNLGKEVSLEYSASTTFYLDDKKKGKPWVTKLHFPVHCIVKTITEDKITGWKFTSAYTYHHGYYDHAEREFRGFGLVEQTDAESFEHWQKSGATNIVDAEFHQEPVVSRTWIHTGAFIEKEKILTQYADEYWYEEMSRNGYNVVNPEVELPDAKIVGATGIPEAIVLNLNVQEWQEALRTCKGMTLRTEVFALDAEKNGNTDAAKIKALTPFTVASHNCFIELIQPKGKNKHAVYVVKESEAITYSYERNTEDPRIAHSLNLKLDLYGNVLEAASIVYGRSIVDETLPVLTQESQGKSIIIYTQNSFTDDAIDDQAYRLRLPAGVMTYELKAVSKAGDLYTPDDLVDILTDPISDELQYHQIDEPVPAGRPQRRLIEHVKTNYYRNDLTGPLPFGELESLAIPFENYQLAYTSELLDEIYGPINVPVPRVTDALMEEGKFVHFEEDSDWWIQSGTTQFITDPETDADAQDRFFIPISYTDPFGSVTLVHYDDTYRLFIDETEDQLGNVSQVTEFNFRTLSPRRMCDINGNFSEVCVDEIGLVKAMALFGKGNEADDLVGFSDFTEQAEKDLIRDFLALPNTPEGVTNSSELAIIGKQLLNHATARFVYDFDVYKSSAKPVVVSSILREEHFQKLNDSPVQLSFEYSGGLGKVVMKKVQAEPGEAKKVTVSNNTIAVTTINTAALAAAPLRWIGNGKTILNNKGNTVKQYEPYFSVTNAYEDFKELVETGVTPLLNYDAVGRLIKTNLPDGTLTKVEFNSWKQVVYDANDTVLDPECTWYSNRINRLIDAKLSEEGKNPAREEKAAEKSAAHANTPNVLHFDSLGRPVLSIDHNKDIVTNANLYYQTKIELDVEGNLRRVTDARALPENSNLGNVVMLYQYDMLGNMIYQDSMDSGKRWLLINALGQPFRTWDERNHEIQYFYDDPMHRPTQTKVIGGESVPLLNHIFDRISYGESLLTAGRANEAELRDQNVLGKPIKHFDTGGVIETPEYDFKNQPRFTIRKLFKNYKEVPNWIDDNLVPDLEEEEYKFISETDALGRITSQTAPDKSIITPSYNEAGLLNGEKIRHFNPGTELFDAEEDYILNIDYNEKGQRNKIIYGNDVVTLFMYDLETFRINQLKTIRDNSDPLQEWHYTFDAVGNITHIEDKNVPVVFFDNQKVTGLSTYTYDALYRLVEATGRENDAALNFGICDNWNDKPFLHQLNPPSNFFIRDYTQRYQYDPVGNILEMKHVATGGSWTRRYVYESDSNRLKSTHVGDVAVPVDYDQYTPHRKHGFLTELPHLENISWNFKEEVVSTTRQRCTDDNIPMTTYYQYDGQGQRIRKITENFAAAGNTPTKKEERIYVAGYETYRTYQANVVNFERESLSLMDEGHRFVMVETVKKNTDPLPPVSDRVGTKLTRYQLHNHLGSAALELDDSAQVISYEEYHPFGTTAYQAKNASIKAAAKRYRYTGMERDEETGMEYHSARYYLPWLGRWLSADPIGLDSGINLFHYSNSSPVQYSDTSGKDWRDDLSWGQRFALWVDDTVGAENMQSAANFSAGMGDTLTLGATGNIRRAMGTDSVIDRNSGSYRTGQVTGIVVAAPLVAEGMALAAPRIAAAVDTMVITARANPIAAAVGVGEFGIGLMDPHPPGASPLDMPGPIDDAGRVLRSTADDYVRAARAEMRASTQVARAEVRGATQAANTDARGAMQAASTEAQSAVQAARADRPPTLLQQARASGAEEHIDERMAVFAHGTTGSTAREMIETQGGNLSSAGGNFGGRLFTVPDINVAGVFANRSASRAICEQPAVVGIALPESTVSRLMQGRSPQLTRRLIDNPPEGVPPGSSEWVFQPGAIDTLRTQGFFFNINF